MGASRCGPVDIECVGSRALLLAEGEGRLELWLGGRGG